MTPPPLDHWIDAVLMLFVSLAQGVAATFGMGRSRKPRDWHTQHPSSALPQTKPDIHIKEQNTSLEAYPLARVPGGGRDPVSAHSALPSRTTPTPVIPAEARERVELEPMSHAHKRQHVPPLASGSRASRASGMTRPVRV